MACFENLSGPALGEIIYFPSNIVLPKHNSVVPTSLLHQPFARTNAFCSSFIPSAVSLWNNLPQEALAADSISSFKALVHPIFLHP